MLRERYFVTQEPRVLALHLQEQIMQLCVEAQLPAWLLVYVLKACAGTFIESDYKHLLKGHPAPSEDAEEAGES